jgi:hypothetical protein
MELDRSVKPLKIPSEFVTLNKLKREKHKTCYELTEEYTSGTPKLPIIMRKRNMRFRDHFDNLTVKLQVYLRDTKGEMKVVEKDKN